jgi:hypothetical protein
VPFLSDCDRVTSATATLHTAVPCYWSGYQEVQYGHYFSFVATLIGVAVAFIQHRTVLDSHLLFLITAARICILHKLHGRAVVIVFTITISSTTFIDSGSSQLCSAVASRRNIHYLERTEPSVPIVKRSPVFRWARTELDWTGLPLVSAFFPLLTRSQRIPPIPSTQSVHSLPISNRPFNSIQSFPPSPSFLPFPPTESTHLR